MEDELFGKRVLVTDHDDWPVTDVVAGYRSQSDAEFGFRQLKDPHVVSFSPMHHWTDHNIRVHTQTCVFALMVAHLMRRQADQAGLHLSVRNGPTNSPASRKPSGSTCSPEADPKPAACSPKPAQPRTTSSKLFDLNQSAPRT